MKTLLVLLFWFATSVNLFAQVSKTTVVVFQDNTGAVSVAPQNLIFVVTPSGAISKDNNQANGYFVHNGQGGYVWNDDPTNPTPGLNREKILKVSWVSADTFELWVGIEKFAVPTYSPQGYPRGFGPEVLLRVKIVVDSSGPRLIVENRQTIMGFLQVNSGNGLAELPHSFKNSNLEGKVWSLPNGGKVEWGVQPQPNMYVCMRITTPEGKTIDFVTLTASVM